MEDPKTSPARSSEVRGQRKQSPVRLRTTGRGRYFFFFLPFVFFFGMTGIP